MIGGEFRYLGEGFNGNLEAEWLPDDDIRQRDRGSFRYHHLGQLDAHWQVRADLYRVSDDRYFEDLGDFDGHFHHADREQHGCFQGMDGQRIVARLPVG